MDVVEKGMFMECFGVGIVVIIVYIVKIGYCDIDLILLLVEGCLFFYCVVDYMD